MIFFILDHWFTVEGTYGIEKHPWQYPALQIHGFAAFGMLIASGALMANHVPASWKTNRLRIEGISLLSALSLQIITAYFVYYASNETFREIIGNVHSINGILLPVLLIRHITK